MEYTYSIYASVIDVIIGVLNIFFSIYLVMAYIYVLPQFTLFIYTLTTLRTVLIFDTLIFTIRFIHYLAVRTYILTIAGRNLFYH